MLQKKVIRIISKSAYLEHTEPLFKQLKILPIRKEYLYCVAQFMYKWNNGHFPKIFDQMFSYNSTYHGYFTRTSTHLCIPRHNLNVRSNSIKIMGVKV